MTDLRTTYLGLELDNPLVPSASPLSRHLDTAKELEDAGAAALVVESLFEEQILAEQLDLHRHAEAGTQIFGEALTYFPSYDRVVSSSEEYLAHIFRLKTSLGIPVIASLNGATPKGWMHYAGLLQEAGADAIELNVYFLASNPDESPAEVEARYFDILAAVRSAVTIPVAVKLGPFFSAFANFAKRLDAAGANGLVLFNRFYQPDLDLQAFSVVPNVLLSTPQAMRLPLRWIAILYGHLKANLAATSGIHTASDVAKMLLVGADVTQMASVLLHEGPEYLAIVLRDLEVWMQENEYESVSQMRGSMSLIHVDDPAAFERTNYMKALKSYR
jgi:dihydroorotate dehydrogenase (fumarate)